jgi:hypothetical protein
MYMRWQEEVQHQWVPRVGIPDPPEMGYGRWNYVEPCCNCVGHMGDSHPMYGMLRIVHVQDVHNHLIDDLGLAIGLGVERSGFCDLGVQQRPETRPKGVEEPVVSVEDDGLWYPN